MGISSTPPERCVLGHSTASGPGRGPQMADLAEAIDTGRRQQKPDSSNKQLMMLGMKPRRGFVSFPLLIYVWSQSPFWDIRSVCS